MNLLRPRPRYLPKDTPMQGPRNRKTCRSCGGPLSTTLCYFGTQPTSNGFLTPAECHDHTYRYAEPVFPLRAVVCSDCFLVQLDYDVPREELFNERYAYFSSRSGDAHWRDYASMAIERFGLDETSRVVEIASNDGYLLKHFVAAAFRPSGSSLVRMSRWRRSKTKCPRLLSSSGPRLRGSSHPAR
jgi:hypothetical protein